ncbi:helix-turn-helix domain-containing protein [Roseomonas hellenica]|uniref:Helix-turn-helix domain-containing protein n=1 Tax=Plastoroseomonas hellenica TaxID=2687306 RepID=A0ABS5EYX6_9PROT|nr:helix-turn-helix domain-containing protein [Plastoroseomonas hellenica]MBR0665501.1 helix-turn-helix domain-containing protein [Plastoroseomonas hellenica]
MRGRWQAGTGIAAAQEGPDAARAPLGRERCVRQAMDAAKAALAQDAAAAPDLSHLAAAAGVSPRSLQRHFARVLGVTPQAAVLRLRLAAAREVLTAGEARSVLDVALRHGFDHPGRFAIAYARAFGEAPSATLRAARRAAPAAAPRFGTPILLRALLPANSAEAARARRLTDDLTIALGRVRDLVLASPEPGPAPDMARALRLDGRVEADCVVLSVVDPARGAVVATIREALPQRAASLAWADRAARAVGAAVAAEQMERARRTPRRHADVETLVLRARPAMLTQDPALTRVALDLLGEALHRDPAHARANALAGFGYAVTANHGFTPDPAGRREGAIEHARRALALAEDDPEVLTLAAGVMSLAGDLREAGFLVTRALALDPEQPEAWRRLGVIQVFRGEARAAAATFRRLLRAWPAGNEGNMAMIQLGIAEFVLGNYPRAARVLARALDQQPFRAWPNRFLTAAAMHAGAGQQAERSLASLRRAFPDLTLGLCERADALQPEAKHRLLDGLARAGLPR